MTRTKQSESSKNKNASNRTTKNKTKTHKKHPNNYSYAQTKEKVHSTKHPNTIYIDDAVDATMKELESSLVPTIYIYLQINIKKLLK